ncbi:MAG: ParB N-terminal domain-containing protein [Bryobacteraceae bacterium]
MKTPAKRLAEGMKVEMWAIEKVIPYARNARKIPQSAIDKVAASIQEFGFRQPIVVDEKGVIVAGHTRLLAAQKLGLSEVPVHVASELTPIQINAYPLADNRIAMESSCEGRFARARTRRSEAGGFRPGADRLRPGGINSDGGTREQHRRRPDGRRPGSTHAQETGDGRIQH